MTGPTRASPHRRWSKATGLYYVSNRAKLVCLDTKGFR
jgi:hypothetical protein